jgi:hypothetical protein
MKKQKGKSELAKENANQNDTIGKRNQNDKWRQRREGEKQEHSERVVPRIPGTLRRFRSAQKVIKSQISPFKKSPPRKKEKTLKTQDRCVFIR